MATRSFKITGSIGGLGFQGEIIRTGEGEISHQVELPKADKGTLTTRTNDTDGTLTMAAGHGISTGDKIDIFWYASGVLKSAHKATVGTVDGTSVPFTAASGDALPAQDSSVTADVLVEVTSEFDGDDWLLLVSSSNRDGYIDFQPDPPGTIYAGKLYADSLLFWAADQGYDRPTSAKVVNYIYLTNASGDYAATAKVGVLYDSVA